MALTSVADYEAATADLLTPECLAFIGGGAGEERTVLRNLDAFRRLALWPRVLIDVSTRSKSVTILGDELDVPILVAPTAMHRMAHEDGELATVRAAGRMGIAMVLSLGSSFPVESVMREATGPVWFQVYVGRDRGLTEAVISRAERAGCRAAVVTVDAPVVGGRIRELRAGFAVNPQWFADGHEPMYGLTAPVASGRAATELWDPSLAWKDLEWLRAVSDMPVVVKGVLRPDDAVRAVDAGVDGLIVSNHGGRQLDDTPAALEALPAIVAAVAGRIPVLVDGGVRTGSDVAKALALGADAVLVGRPVLWGLAVEGEAGVERVLEILASELDLTMALCGASALEHLTSDLVSWD